jgi:HEAT repeat protein
MRFALAIFCLAGAAFAHGESSRTPSPPVGTQVLPTGGPTTGGPSPKGGGPTTVKAGDGVHTWKVWWAYHREYILADRTHGTPVTGVAPGPDPDGRRQLRDQLYDVLLEALEDKDHRVRAAAAVALGKWGRADAERALRRHDEYPGEGWFTVREAALYALGLLGVPDNRIPMIRVAGDKDRAIKERSLALTSLLVDGTRESADLLVWHLRYHRSGSMTNATMPPRRSEQDRRRFAAHLLGFVELEGYDDVLDEVVAGSRYWGPGEQGLAVTALGHRKAKDRKEEFFRLLYRRQADDEVKRSAAIALGQLIEGTDRNDVKRLARFVRDSKRDDIAQNFAVMALGTIGGPHVVEVLSDFIRSNTFANGEDRNFVYIALGLQGAKSKEARDLLLAEYERRASWSERAALAVALGLARCGDAIPRTVELIGRANPSNDFLPWAALALGLHGDAKRAGVLEDLFDTYHVGGIRQKAALGLTLLLGSKAVPKLVEIIEEEGSLHAKAGAVEALRLLKRPDRKAVKALVAAYRRDSNPDSVRAMAIVAIGALGDPRTVPLSARLVRHYNYFIRCLALDQIAAFL